MVKYEKKLRNREYAPQDKKILVGPHILVGPRAPNFSVFKIKINLREFLW